VERTLNFMTSRSVRGEDLGFTFPEVETTAEIMILHRGTNTFWDNLFQDLNAAQNHIHVAMYGVWGNGQSNDRDSPESSQSTAYRLLKLLRTRAEQGVQVCLIIDKFGSRLAGPRRPKNEIPFLEQPDSIALLTHPNITLLYNDPWNLARLESFFKLDHRKLYVIDGKIAYVGGIGVENQFDNSFTKSAAHDVMVRLQGEIVSQFQSAFLDSFCYQLSQNGKLPRDIFNDDINYLRQKYFTNSTPPPGATVRARCVTNVPVAAFYDYSETYLKMIHSTRECLYLANSYYSDDDLTKAVQQTARRLQDNNIVWKPGQSCGRGLLLIFPAASRMSLRDELMFLTNLLDPLKHDATVLRYTAGWLHAKVMLRDDQQLVIGSCNLDFCSIQRNWEIGILMEGETLVKIIKEQMFTADEPPQSEKITKETVSWKKRLLCKLADLLPWF